MRAFFFCLLQACVSRCAVLHTAKCMAGMGGALVGTGSRRAREVSRKA